MAKVRNILVLIFACLMSVTVFSSLAAESATKIVVWACEPLEEELIPTFERSHPTIKIDFRLMGAWDLHDKFMVTLATGTGAPDVGEIVMRRFMSFMQTEELFDITSQTEGLGEDYPSAMWEMVHYRGRVYGLPVAIPSAALFYRADLFKKWGFEVPIDTWDDYIEIGKKLPEETYLLPLFIPAGQWGTNLFTLYLNSRGGNLYTPDGKFIKDNELLVDTLQWYVDLYAKHKVADTIRFFTPEFWAAFQSGRFVSWPIQTFEPIMSLKRYMPEAGTWGVQRFLRWKEREIATTGLWGGYALPIPKQSEHKDEALTFIMWISHSVDGQIAWCKMCGDSPIYNRAAEHPFFTKPDPYFGASPYAVAATTPVPDFYYFDWAETAAIVGKQLDLLFAGTVTAGEVYENMQKEIGKKLGR